MHWSHTLTVYAKLVYFLDNAKKEPFLLRLNLILESLHVNLESASSVELQPDTIKIKSRGWRVTINDVSQ